MLTKHSDYLLLISLDFVTRTAKETLHSSIVKAEGLIKRELGCESAGFLSESLSLAGFAGGGDRRCEVHVPEYMELKL